MAKRSTVTNPVPSESESQAITEEILRRADLPTIAPQLGVPVTRGTNNTAKALCPFHEDHNPSLSFYKSSDRWNFRCFACGESGDVFDFVAKIQKTDFLNARAWVADQTGVQLTARTRSSQRDLRSEGQDRPRDLSRSK